MGRTFAREEHSVEQRRVGVMDAGVMEAVTAPVRADHERLPVAAPTAAPHAWRSPPAVR